MRIELAKTERPFHSKNTSDTGFTSTVRSELVV